jgi:hypothetical protein
MRLLAAAVTLAALNAAATPGFFRTPTDVAVPADGSTAITLASQACAIQVRYNNTDPTNLELQYIGDNSCFASMEQAIKAAAAAKAAIVGGEPANTPVYQCSHLVAWDPPQAGNPTVTTTGAGCDNTKSQALASAVKAVACNFHVTPCR